MIIALKKANTYFATQRKIDIDAFDVNTEADKKEALGKGKLNTAFKHIKTMDFSPMLYLKEKGDGQRREFHGLFCNRPD